MFLQACNIIVMGTLD